MNVSYQVTVIMAVYNVEQYIEEAIQSLIRQTIGFENIQVIMVNDGSTDNSKAICQKYASQYSNNIVYLEQSNKGQSAARNAGLKHALGKYINFLDPDDILSDNAIEEALRFLECHSLEIDFVTIPLMYFEGESGLHAKYRPLGRKNRIVNLLHNPECFILSSSASFYKREILSRHKFDCSLVTAEDMELNAELYRENPQFGYVCENQVLYFYRRRIAGGSNVDKVRSGSDIRPWTGITHAFQLAFGDRVLRDFEMEMISYELRSRLRDLRRDAFPDQKSYDSLLADYSTWISKLSDNFILYRSYYLDSKEKKALFLQLKGSSIRESMLKGLVDASTFKVWLKSISISEKHIQAEVLFNNMGCPFDLVIADSSNSIILPIKSKDISSPYDLTIGEFVIDSTHYRQFALPNSDDCYKFLFHDTSNGIYYNAHSLVPGHNPPIMTAGELYGVVKFEKKVYVQGNSVVVEPNSKSSFANGVESMLRLKKSGKPIALLRPFSKQAKKYILINDRPEKAGDNGQALFEHIMRSGNEKLKAVTYYVLDKHCSDYQSTPFKDHIVQPYSIKHKILFLNARLIYSSHNARKFYLPFAHGGKYYCNLFDYSFVWLQHGTIANDVSKQANRLNTGDDFIICGAIKERQELLREQYFFEDHQVLMTGLARYDKLTNHPKRIITIAPTWRADLVGAIKKTGFHQPLPGFTQSNYFKQFAELLSSETLYQLLQEHDFICQFVLHAGVACYEKDFAPFANDRIKILRQETVSYSKLFEESSLFITDYSSTAFDFAYLRKPIVYFQFDEDVFFSKHYLRGYFDFRLHGFGPVVSSVECLLKEIRFCLDNDCFLEERYRNRINGFFAHEDKCCCQRILEATLPEDLK